MEEARWAVDVKSLSTRLFPFFFLEGGKGGKEVYKEKIITITKN